VPGLATSFVEVAYTSRWWAGRFFAWRVLRVQLFLPRGLPDKSPGGTTVQPQQFISLGSDVVFFPYRSAHRPYTLDVETYVAGGPTFMLMRSWTNNVPAPPALFAPVQAIWIDAPPEPHWAAHLETGIDLGLPYLPEVHVRPYASVDLTGMEGIGWLGYRFGLTLAWRFGAPDAIAQRVPSDVSQPAPPPAPL
jgi:hypothetical protein